MKYIAVKHEMKNGKAYRLIVYKNLGISKGLRRIGEKTAYYGTQYGEENEAWQVILSHNPRLKSMLKKAGCEVDTCYFHSEYEDAGIVDIQII